MNSFSRISWFLAVAALVTFDAHGAASRRAGGSTLVVAPARYSVLQVAMDIVDRERGFLVSYQGEPTSDEPLLHLWNGAEWEYLPFAAYKEGVFLPSDPKRTVLIGGDDVLPHSLVDASAWSPLVMSVPALDSATIVNSFGNIVGFRKSDWRWYSARYQLELTDLKGEYQVNWYDQPYGKRVRFERNQQIDVGTAGPTETVYREHTVSEDQRVANESLVEEVGTVEAEEIPAARESYDDDLPPAAVVLPPGETPRATW